jgi:hypothetical protein
VNIDRRDDGSIHLTQPHLIKQILKDLRMDGDNIKPRSTPQLHPSYYLDTRIPSRLIIPSITGPL